MSSLGVKKLHEHAKLPTRGTHGAAGFDLYADTTCRIASGDRAVVGTGISVQVPTGHCLQIWPRSGTAVRNGIETGAGIIDADYTGELKVLLFNHGDTAFVVEKNMRIAQFLIVPVLCPLKVIECNLKKTERGSNGFGSTGL